MRLITIIGAGQAGLQLSISLLEKGYSVTLYSSRTAEEVLNGRIMSSQGMFASALKLEQSVGLNFWDDLCPKNEFVTFNLGTPLSSEVAFSWCGRTDNTYQSIDQRIKFSYWMNYFQKLGGTLIIKDIALKDLDKIASNQDLTIIAGGKSEICQNFAINSQLSKFTKPQRELSCLYIKGLKSITGIQGVRANIIPYVGEYFVMPGLTKNGSCHMMLFEGIPGGNFDCWHDISSPYQQLEKAIELLKNFVPWEAELCESIDLTDSQATLLGRVLPTVRNPFFTLPCGKSVLGLGDALVLNDPISGQGANNACKAANIYFERILAHGKNNFSPDWMKDTFEIYWDKYAKWSTKWSEILLMPPEPHVIKLLEEASANQEIANHLANSFDNPSTLFPWISNSTDTLKFIEFKKDKTQIPYFSSEYPSYPKKLSTSQA